MPALKPDAPPAPAVYGAYSTSAQPFRPAGIQLFLPGARTSLQGRDMTPAGSELRVDARASADGQRWSVSGRWVWANGSAPYSPGRRAGRSTARRCWATRTRCPASATLPSHPSAARRCLAPRRGASGANLEAARHAHGHGWRAHRQWPPHHQRPISCRCRRRLLPEGTSQYTVRITYNGRSSVAPVYDVGPGTRTTITGMPTASASRTCRRAGRKTTPPTTTAIIAG